MLYFDLPELGLTPVTRRLIGFALITLFIALAPAAGNAAIDATQTSSEAIGKHIDFLREDGARKVIESNIVMGW